jgi:phosphatidate phosphatase APP1
LAEFLRAVGFPAGSLHFRPVRLTDRTVAAMFKSPREHKLKTIGGLMREFPRRRFILVGDSGEEDPEVYGEIARAYPEAVVRILIRNVTSENRSANRFAEAFRQVPPARWEVFERPEEIVGAILPVSKEH